jgi:HrpA-like RNA helicase
MLSVEPVFFCPNDQREESQLSKKQFINFDGDHLTLLNVFNQYETGNWCKDNFINPRSMRQIIDIRTQLLLFCNQLKITINPSKKIIDVESILKCFLTGFFKNVAIRQQDGSYLTVNRQQVWIHPSSTLFNVKNGCELVMFNEWVQTSRAYLRNVSRIQASWVSEVAPHYYKK